MCSYDRLITGGPVQQHIFFDGAGAVSTLLQPGAVLRVDPADAVITDGCTTLGALCAVRAASRARRPGCVDACRQRSRAAGDDTEVWKGVACGPDA